MRKKFIFCDYLERRRGRHWSQDLLNRLPSTPPCQEEWKEDRSIRSVWLPIGVIEFLERSVLTDWNSREGFSCHKLYVMGTLWWYFIKAWSDTIIESLRFLKWVLSLISLVKMLLGLSVPGMCYTLTSLDWWHSLTMFSMIFILLIPLDVTEADHWTQALFPL